jgi:hypothetical protein
VLKKCPEVHSDESIDAKIIMGFVALIVRNKIYIPER